MTDPSLDKLIANYRELFLKYQKGPEVGQWSAEGQRFRFLKLLEVGNLSGASVLDVGCGLGDLYPVLAERFGSINYSGIDIVPEIIAEAGKRNREGRFYCQNLIEEPLDAKFDYVLMSGIFNNPEIPDTTVFLKKMVSAAFQYAGKALAFNFTSTHVSFTDPKMAYHDPKEIFSFCLDSISKKISMHHHYQNRDVAMFLYR